MLELTEISQTAREHIEEIGVADLVIGIFSPFASDQAEAALAGIRESVRRLYMHVRTVVVHAGDEPLPGAPASDGDDVRVLSVSSLKADSPGDPAHGIMDSFHRLFALGDFLHARASAA